MEVATRWVLMKVATQVSQGLWLLHCIKAFQAHICHLGKHHFLFPCISHQLSHCSYFVGAFTIYQINIRGEMSEIEKMVTHYLNLSCFLS